MKGDSVDEDMLKRVIRDAGRWAFGLIAVEVWVLNVRSSKLEHPSGGGLWVDPTYINSFPTDDDDGLPPPTESERKALDAVERLVDPEHPLYIPARSISPGVGLAGALWTEADTMSPRNSKGMRGGVSQDVNDSHNVIWRDVPGLAADPDQPPNERLGVLADAGVGLAAGVPFQLGKNHRGIVVYMTRKTANPDKLRAPINETYLHSATAAIGAVSALRGPRLAAVEERRKERQAAVQRVYNRLIILKRTGADVSKILTSGQPLPSVGGGPVSLSAAGKADVPETAPDKPNPYIHTYVKKIVNGGGAHPPPPFKPFPALYASGGVLITMVSFYFFSDALNDNAPSSLAPFAGLSYTYFLFSAAPAAQPRHILYAQAVALVTGKFIQYIPGIPQWIKTCGSPALVTFFTAILGVPHPPAAAFAVNAAGGTPGPNKWDWVTIAVMYVCLSVSIGIALLYNNILEKRQYPTYWALDNLGPLTPHKMKKKGPPKK